MLTAASDPIWLAAATLAKVLDSETQHQKQPRDIVLKIKGAPLPESSFTELLKHRWDELHVLPIGYQR